MTLKASGAQPVWNVPPPIYINHTMVSIVNEHNDTMALDARSTVVIVRKGYGVRLINVVTGEVGKFQYSMLASSLVRATIPCVGRRAGKNKKSF